MEGQLKRYNGLRLQESFSRSHHYPSACEELALILKLSYSELPRTLQSLVVQDVITAFRLLPRMQTQTAVEAANTLLEAVETELPKQKKAQALTKFKKAVVVHKRSSEPQNNKKDLPELPQDVLVHLFSFLDLQSLFSSSQVCRSWNVASNNNHLWHSIYIDHLLYLANMNTDDLIKDEENDDNNIDWKGAFEEAHGAFSWKKLLVCSSRGICMHCHAIFWVSDIGSESFKKVKCNSHHLIKAISTRKIVDYIIGGYDSSAEEEDETESSDYENASDNTDYETEGESTDDESDFSQ